MKVTLWGTRGSLATPGPETTRYGGNTSCVEVCGPAGTRLILDAGTGLRRLGASLPGPLRRVDLLLTHLHLDHIEGIGFFAPLYDPDTEVHLWGPPSATMSLRQRLMRYLSPPLFPLYLRDLPAPDRVQLHDVPRGEFAIGEFRVTGSLVCHPGPTLGYRVTAPATSATLAYLPDHEPALGVQRFPLSADWTSGYALAQDAHLLLHDAQYDDDEYAAGRIGWGHSTWRHAIDFAALARVKRLLAWHHDPDRHDDALDRLCAASVAAIRPNFPVSPAAEGETFDLLS